MAAFVLLVFATNSIGEIDSLERSAAVAVFLTVGFLSCIGCCAPGWVWRVVCRTAGRSERAEPTPTDIARIQYYIVRLFYLDIGGFLLNPLAGSWLAVLFAVDIEANIDSESMDPDIYYDEVLCAIVLFNWTEEMKD